MLEAFEKAAERRPSSHIHVEYFVPKIAGGTSGGFVVELARSDGEYVISRGQDDPRSLAGGRGGVASSCEEGIYGSCETTVVSGIPDHRDSVLTDDERSATKTMMICCSASESDRLVLDI